MIKIIGILKQLLLTCTHNSLKKPKKYSSITRGGGTVPNTIKLYHKNDILVKKLKTIHNTNMTSTSEYTKNFDGWNNKKQLIENKKTIFFEERQIWWCSVGVNVGSEIDGKNHNFERPILIIKKYGKNTFLGVPMSTTIREGNYYFDISTNGTFGQLLFNQAKTMDSKRLLRKIAKISSSSFEKIKQQFKSNI